MQPYTESLVRTGKIPEGDGLDNLQHHIEDAQ